MVDIDPSVSAPRYAPRDTNLVDAVAEVTRIAEQGLRSNPLKNAKIDGGLTEWRGNYGGSLVWIGDIFPADQNLLDQYGNPRPQRAFVVQRDDPNQDFAFLMYDPAPAAGVPLRQLISIRDADGKAMIRESRQGGRGFPDQPIVMYQRESFENPAAVWTSDRTIYSGEGNLTATRLELRGAWTNSDGGATTISTYVRVSGGGVTITTATTNIAGNQNYNQDINVKTIYDVSDMITVEWHMWRTAGVGSFVPRLFRCRVYGS